MADVVVYNQERDGVAVEHPGDFPAIKQSVSNHEDSVFPRSMFATRDMRDIVEVRKTGIGWLIADTERT